MEEAASEEAASVAAASEEAAAPAAVAAGDRPKYKSTGGAMHRRFCVLGKTVEAFSDSHLYMYLLTLCI